MTGIKTVAERLREIEGESFACDGDVLSFALGRKLKCPVEEKCSSCIGRLANELADAIEAEQAHAVSKEPRGAEPQLPAGIEWPRFPDGELVKFGQHIAQQLENPKDLTRELNGVVRSFTFAVDYLSVSDGKDELCFLYGEPVKRPEPEVLDADGVPIKVGDTVWYTDELPTKKFVGDRCTVKTIERIRDRYSIKVLNEDRGHFQYDLTGKFLTHRKPDTAESIFSEMVSAIESGDCVDLAPYIERYRRLKGGE